MRRMVANLKKLGFTAFDRHDLGPQQWVKRWGKWGKTFNE